MGSSDNPNLSGVYGIGKDTKKRSPKTCYEVEPEVWDAAYLLSTVLIGVQDQKFQNYIVATKLLEDKEYFKTEGFRTGGFSNHEKLKIQSAWNLVNRHHNPIEGNRTCGFSSPIWNSAYVLAMSCASSPTNLNDNSLIRETNKLLHDKKYFKKRTANLDINKKIILKSCYHVVQDYHKEKTGKCVDDDDHFPGYGRNDN